MHTINKHWFSTVLADRQISQRRLAEMLSLDYGAMSRTFKGTRRLQIDEAAEIAKILEKPLDEVLTHAGIDVSLVARREGKVRVAGWADAELIVQVEGQKGERWVARPPHTAPGLEAIRLRTAASAADSLDGAIAYYVPRPGIPAEAMGRWCVVTLPDGSRRIRVLRPGYRNGTYNLMSPFAGSVEEDVVVESAAPILWVQM